MTYVAWVSVRAPLQQTDSLTYAKRAQVCVVFDDLRAESESESDDSYSESESDDSRTRTALIGGACCAYPPWARVRVYVPRSHIASPDWEQRRVPF